MTKLDDAVARAIDDATHAFNFLLLEKSKAYSGQELI
jgi:hypothetical protein